MCSKSPHFLWSEIPVQRKCFSSHFLWTGIPDHRKCGDKETNVHQLNNCQERKGGWYLHTRIVWPYILAPLTCFRCLALLWRLANLARHSCVVRPMARRQFLGTPSICSWSALPCVKSSLHHSHCRRGKSSLPSFPPTPPPPPLLSPPPPLPSPPPLLLSL